MAVENREVELLERARAGDAAAGEELFTKYLKESRPIAALLRKGLRRPEDREEVLHEIYLQLTTGANAFRGESKLSTYVYQVARITLLQRYRRENTLKRGKIYRRAGEPSDVSAGQASNPEYAYTLKQGRAILEEMIGRLPETYREVMRLRVLDDLSYDQIAGRLQIPLNTVSTRIHKGKKLLADMLKEKGFTEVLDF